VSQSWTFPRLSGAPAHGPGEAREALEDEVTIDVSGLLTGGGPPQPGGRFQFYAQARDRAEQVGESQIHFLEVVAKEDLLRILTDQLMIVKDQLNEALRLEISARKDLAAFHEQVSLEEKIPLEEAGKLFRHRHAQHRVTQVLERQTHELDRILARTERNRLGDQDWKQWVTGIRDDVRSLGEKESPAIETAIAALEKGAAEGSRVTDLGVVQNQQREIEREIQALVLRLTEFGDKNALIQMLREVRRRQATLREETRSRAKKAVPEEPQK
jgi:hypothetical protein